MRKRALIIGLVAIAGGLPLTAGAATCPRAQPAQVRVQLIDPAPSITLNKSLKQINASATGHGLVGKGKRALGITESELEASINISFIGQKQRRGQATSVCLNVKSVEARFGHRKLVVSLPREYPPGFCKFQVVHRHEMAHVDVARRTVRKYAILLRGELERAVQKSNPMSARTMEQGSAAYQKHLQAVVAALGKRFEAEASALHAKIDAPGSAYAANGACKGW